MVISPEGPKMAPYKLEKPEVVEQYKGEDLYCVVEDIFLPSLMYG